jgi:hypothetical protein
MSLASKFDSEKSNDWMRELAQDADNVQMVLKRIDELAARAQSDLAINKNPVGAMIRLGEIQEGIQLLCQLMGVKVTPYAVTQS